MSAPITVDVWSDLACPWCYIGKRKFEEGVRRFGGEVAVTYHSYELSPETPVDFEGSELDFLVAYKGQPREVMQRMVDQVTATAAAAGLTYDFDRLHHTNTVLAHQLLHLARERGRQPEMAERLFRAYFTEGGHIGRIESLAELAAEIGLDPDEVRRALTAEEYLPAVRADQEQARAYGITGVPFFVLDGRYGISGAQDPDTFAAALTQVAAEVGSSAR